MWQKIAIGLFALAGLYVWVSGDYTFVGPRYRMLGYAEMAAAQLRAPPPTAEAAARTTSAASPSPGTANATVSLTRSDSRTRASGHRYVHLASLPSAASAEVEWSRLRRIHPQQLANLEHVVRRVQLGAKGVVYRVLADTSQSPLTPGQLCTALRKNNQYCAPVASDAG